MMHVPLHGELGSCFHLYAIGIFNSRVSSRGVASLVTDITSS